MERQGKGLPMNHALRLDLVDHAVTTALLRSPSYPGSECLLLVGPSTQLFDAGVQLPPSQAVLVPREIGRCGEHGLSRVHIRALALEEDQFSHPISPLHGWCLV